MPALKTRRTCPEGHHYYKSSDCPVCPVCEKRQDREGFLSVLSAPARRALEHAGINTLVELAQRSESEILALHGMGPSSLPKLRDALATQGLAFLNHKKS